MEWSEMLREILDLVAQKYVTFYEDYPSFAGVCKSWRLAAVHNARTCHNSNGPPSRFPSLMLAEKSEDKEFRELFLLSNKSIRKIRLPEAYGKLCMSSCGWLLTVGDDNASQLINPLSRETINLPKVNTFPEFSETSEWNVGISKLVLLIPFNLVVVLWGRSRKLGFCHIGDNKWTDVAEGWRGQIYDITYYNGRAPNEVFGAYILGLDDSERKRLLVVIRGLLDNIGDESCVETYKTKSFQIFQYDLENGKWSKVQDLDDVLELYGGSQKGGGRDMGIYHLSDGTIEPHFSGESRSLFTPPIWLQSIIAAGSCQIYIRKLNTEAMLYLLYLVLMTNGNTKLSNFRMFHILPRMPEVQTNALKKESDVYCFRVLVYSFGVLLFEVLCGKVCYDLENNILVPEWKRMYETNTPEYIIFEGLITEEMDPHSLKVFADIAYRCLNDRSRDDRPTAAKAVIELEAALETQKMSEGQEQLIDYELEAALLYFFRG
ncbi:hypothetical protein Tco_0995386, partial [Tanacetum coccineum]